MLGRQAGRVMCPWPPAGSTSRARDLGSYADYRTAERKYYRRTRIFDPQYVVLKLGRRATARSSACAPP
jgi:hypothetical protein